MTYNEYGYSPITTIKTQNADREEAFVGVQAWRGKQVQLWVAEKNGADIEVMLDIESASNLKNAIEQAIRMITT